MSDTIDLDEAKRLLAEASPRPWEDRDTEILSGDKVIGDFDGPCTCDQDGVNAALAVHAVNNYAALVERCEKAEAEVVRLTRELEDQGPHWPSCPGACGGCR